MMRKLFGLFAVALLLCAGVVMADEIKGKITKVDVDKKTMTVSVDGKETEYAVSDDCKFPAGKGGKAGSLKGVETKVNKAKDSGKDVKGVLTTEKKGAKEVVTEFKYDTPKAKDKSDK